MDAPRHLSPAQWRKLAPFLAAVAHADAARAARAEVKGNGQDRAHTLERAALRRATLD